MSKQAKHTPGPWSVTTSRSTGSGQPWITRDYDTGGVLSTVFDGENPQTFPLSQANARLIATAPDLLAACEAVLNAIEAFPHAASKTPLGKPQGGIAKALRAAIASARGE